MCIHVDADAGNDSAVLQNKIDPAFKAVDGSEKDLCKNLVAVIPVYMSEAWMLADKELLKDEIDTAKTNEELGLNRAPESISDPKDVIKTALRLAHADLPKRRNRLTISDLYQTMGQKIAIDKLVTLPSYLKFKSAVEGALKRLNYLH